MNSQNSRIEPGWGPLAVLMGGIFLVVLDFFIVNVALPSMQRDLHASDSGLEWVVAGYGLTFSALLIAVTRLGDRWGRRRMFSWGTALFVVASAACGAAPTTELLVGARLGQGIAGAMVSPMVLALIGDVYAGPRMPKAIGIYSMVMGLAAATGQLIGGILIHLDLADSGWRAIFWVNVPIGLAVVALSPRLLPDRRNSDAARIDVVELLLATTTLTALLLPAARRTSPRLARVDLAQPRRRRRRRSADGRPEPGAPPAWSPADGRARGVPLAHRPDRDRRPGPAVRRHGVVLPCSGPLPPERTRPGRSLVRSGLHAGRGALHGRHRQPASRGRPAWAAGRFPRVRVSSRSVTSPSWPRSPRTASAGRWSTWPPAWRWQGSGWGSP